MTRLWPSLLGAAQVVQPETILRWHGAGFTAFWRRKSRKRGGRPKIDRGLRDLIQRMSKEKCARTWRWARMRPLDARSIGAVSLSPSQSCPGCTTNTSGYDFRKGQAACRAFSTNSSVETGKSAQSAQLNRSQDSGEPPTS